MNVNPNELKEYFLLDIIYKGGWEEGRERETYIKVPSSEWVGGGNGYPRSWLKRVNRVTDEHFKKEAK